MSKPQQSHWDSVLYILCCLNYTGDLGVFFQAGPMHLQGFIDADYLSCVETKLSINAYVFTLASGPISWSSKEQPTISESTTETKYKALSKGAKEAVYIHTLGVYYLSFRLLNLVKFP